MKVGVTDPPTSVKVARQLSWVHPTLGQAGNLDFRRTQLGSRLIKGVGPMVKSTDSFIFLELEVLESLKEFKIKSTYGTIWWPQGFYPAFIWARKN